MDVALDVKDLHVMYRSASRMRLKSILSGKRSSEVVHAIRGMSFSVGKGEILGIVGRNGSGKSTLLKTIAGIFSPDEGTIDLHGSRVSLLALGVGFVPELSGRENILLSGLLMGFTKEEIRAREADIIEYFGKEDFIDYPVKTYSSGMYSRLAFSISAFLETDILLIDEALSVGDEEFRAKSFETMKNLITDDEHTVVMVSHNLSQIEEFCSRVIWMEDGAIVMEGDVGPVLQSYRNRH